MAAYRESMPAETWLEQKAYDTSVASFDESTLATLQHTCGAADIGDTLDARLQPEGVDFATASEEQIFSAANQIIQSSAPGGDQTPVSGSEESATDDEEIDVRSLVPEPSYEQLAREMLTSIYEDPTFAETLRQHLAATEIAEADADTVAEAIAAELAQAVAEGVAQAFQDAYGQHGATPPTSEELYQALAGLGLLS